MDFTLHHILHKLTNHKIAEDWGLSLTALFKMKYMVLPSKEYGQLTANHRCSQAATEIT